MFGFLGYLHNKYYNSINGEQEIIKNNNIINLVEISGFVLDIVDYFLISSEKLAPGPLYHYYSQHKILINIIYILAGFVLIGIFSVAIYIKSNKRKMNNQFNEIELR